MVPVLIYVFCLLNNSLGFHKMSMVKVTIYSILIISVCVFMSEEKTTKTDTSSRQSDCMNRHDTQLIVASFQKQYPNLSKSQITYQVCK